MKEEYYAGLSLFSEVINITKDGVTGEQKKLLCCPFIHLHSAPELSKSYSEISI